MQTPVYRLAILGIAALLITARGHAAFGTSVPVTAQLATSIAGSLFPRTLPMDEGSLFVSDPLVVYPAASDRLHLRVNVQVLQRQADQSLKASAPAQAELSGELGYDRESVKILLKDPRLESLTFGPAEPHQENIRAQVFKLWDQQVTDPLRVDLPPHPILLPFREGIKNVSMAADVIVVELGFE